jgi:hypothetical protein
MLAVTVTAGADMAIRQGKVLLQNVEAQNVAKSVLTKKNFCSMLKWKT